MPIHLGCIATVACRLLIRARLIGCSPWAFGSRTQAALANHSCWVWQIGHWVRAKNTGMLWKVHRSIWMPVEIADPVFGQLIIRVPIPTSVHDQHVCCAAVSDIYAPQQKTSVSFSGEGRRNAQPAGRLAGRALGAWWGRGSPEKPICHLWNTKMLFVLIWMQRLLVIRAAGRILFSATAGSSAVGFHLFPD